MHLNHFCLLVTLFFMVCCTTFASADGLIQDKSVRKNSRHELTDKSHRNLKDNIEAAADEERVSMPDSKFFRKILNPNASSKASRNVRNFFKKTRDWLKKVWTKAKIMVGLKKKSKVQSGLDHLKKKTENVMGIKKKRWFKNPFK